MKKSFNKFFLAPLTVLVLASFALAPIAEAGRGGGGGHGGGARAGGGGGGAHASGGGNRQVNNSRADVRTIPPNCVPVNYGGVVYQQCGTTW